MRNYTYQKPKKIDWLKQIPTHWEEVRLGSLFTQRKEKVSDIDYAPLSVTKNGVVPQLDNAAKSNDGSNRKLVLKGDFAINSRSDRKGSSGVSIYDGSVSLIYIVLKPIKIEPRYSEYLLKSYYFKEEYYRYGRGIVEDLWTTRYSEMKNMIIPSAPLSEQTDIANFLDYKLEKINRFITKKKQLIELLTEQKAAIINKAVTKGINPNAKLKPSGIEWLGDIPEHWEVRKLKSQLEIYGRIGYRGYKTTDLVDKGEGAITISPSNMKEFHMQFKDSSYLSWEKYEESPEIKIYNNDILFVKTGSTYGKVSLVKDLNEKATINPQIVVFKKIKLNEVYLWYHLKSQSIKTQVELSVVGGTIPTISQSKIGAYSIVVPPNSEQKSIVEHIMSETVKIDKTISTIEKEIALVEEYKTALIAEAVTGKIDVRDFEAPSTEEPLEMVAEEASNFNKAY